MANSSVTLSCKELGYFDLVVVGGGCTGVFAAVRAARLGLKVAIVEKSGCFGGVATNTLVNVWHSLWDTEGKEQIIFGLTHEVQTALLKSGKAMLENTASAGIRFDPNALKVQLDRLVTDCGIRIFFHTFYTALECSDGRIQSVLVTNKDGLCRLSAAFFIDATGDGDLCRDAKLPSFVSAHIQPASPCCFAIGDAKDAMADLVRKHGHEFGLEDDWGWAGMVPGLEDIRFRADFHIFGRRCDTADALTAAELEGRRKIYAMERLLKTYADPKFAVVALSSHIGVRETVHYRTRFQATEKALLLGVGYDDTVMRGTYRVDIHHDEDNGITFKYLNGNMTTTYGRGRPPVRGNWREAEGITAPVATYYQVPFDILVQEQVENLIPVGRMLNADEGAFGALRVMVNLNQLGEAAGVAAYLAVQQEKPIWQIPGKDVKKETGV